MKRLFIVAGILFWQISLAQTPDSLTLDDCYRRAVANYPLTNQFELLASKNKIQLKKLNTNYLPHLNINGQASYQSDVTQVEVVFQPMYLPPPLDIQLPALTPDIPVPPKDQYRITLGLNQTIYDGGITSRQKYVERTNLEIDRQNVEIELYKLKEQINQVFFGIVLLQENSKLLIVFKKEISNKLKDIETAVKYGIALESDKDVLLAELIKIEQQLEEVEITKNAWFRVLGELMSVKADPSTYLILPDPHYAPGKFENSRLEYELFDLQKEKINATKRLTSAQWMPKLMGFGQLGYGKPGLNMMNNTFDTYYIVGASLNWNIWNWNKYKKENQILDLQSLIINSRKETFNKITRITAENDIAEIRKYEALIRKDHEIIELRDKIAGTASSQLDNGIITSTDYVTKVNDAVQSKINLETHKIQLVQAKMKYLATIGEL
ncbi:MAG: TolC family protein [Bacteroidetes bacterium]|nr:TolC family protein [Bacteroidota bacterium]